LGQSQPSRRSIDASFRKKRIERDQQVEIKGLEIHEVNLSNSSHRLEECRWVWIITPMPHPPELHVPLTINGRDYRPLVPPHASLLDVLREALNLFGTKKGCDVGTCGACTVLVDGRRINACLALAAAQEGRNILTIEGLEQNDGLHPLQQAFIDNDALQCGYCTPGQIMSAVGFLAEGRSTDHAVIAEAMSGNLCRCGAYPNIVTAISVVAGRPE